MIPRRLLPSFSRAARRGVALLEVMVALTVFTASSFALVLALSKTLDTANDRNQIDLAVRGLQNQMALLHATRLLPGETDAPDDGSGVQYRVVVEQITNLQDKNNANIPNMYRATITATWKAENAIQTQTVSELIYQP